MSTTSHQRGFYKGTRTGTVGRHTKYGGFIIDFSRVRTYVCPSLENFKLTPFVTEKKERKFGYYGGDPQGPRSPQLYLERLPCPYTAWNIIRTYISFQSRVWGP
ncbi:hypothetical protein P8C59_008856 [Phyllachora maydis]|uniref:Ribosomal protein L27 n=1 Tax=Phyllachora maydis TaxID=1825666 RepID=A0AAD9IBY8_9PEZI|nr:hypothetical protein P8C59_008856 [Phyllachora maydis]